MSGMALPGEKDSAKNRGKGGGAPEGRSTRSITGGAREGVLSRGPSIVPAMLDQ